MDNETLKFLVAQVVNGISNYSENISMRKFNKSICELDQFQLEKIDSLFHGIIGFTNLSSNTKVDVPRNPEE